jgi:hypothetical protein
VHTDITTDFTSSTEAIFSLQKARPYKRGTTAWVKVFFRTNTENVLLLNVGHTKSPVRIEM